MKLLFFLVRTYRWSVLFIVFISLVGGSVNTALIGLINQQLTAHAVLNTRFIGAFGLLVLLTILLDLWLKQLLSWLTGWTSYHLRMNLVEQILDTPLVRLEALGTPRLLAILTDDIARIAQLLASLPTLCSGAATIMIAILYLGWLSPLALIALVVLTVPTVWGYRHLQRKSRLLNLQNLSARDALFALYRALLEGNKELKLHTPRRHTFLHQVLEPTVAKIKQTGIKARYWQHLASTWSQSIYFIFVIVIFVLSRWQGLSMEVMTGYALIVLYLKSSIISILTAMPLWSETNVTLGRIAEDGFRLLSQPTATTTASGASKVVLPVRGISPITGDRRPLEITLHELFYHYQVEQEEAGFTIGPLSLDLRAGELVFLCGGNGSGKTTLIKLLAGLYQPDAGRICWNGIPVCSQNQEAYRQNFTAIFAEPFLFEQLLGIEQVDLDQQAQRYLETLQLERKVRVVDGHLSTLNLSYGQRKRLALLTAWLEDRPAYIFDEWAAGQDPAFREIFYHQFLPELRNRGKLVIVVSHDDHYYAVADRIIKLDFGKIESDSERSDKVLA